MKADALAAIYAAAFPDGRAWQPSEFDALLADRFTFLCPHLSGFALGRCIAGEAELLTIAVMPQHQGNGIGQALLLAFEQQAESREATDAFLEVAADNAPAISLYQRGGYCESGRRRGYYTAMDGSKTDALLFSKALKPTLP